MKKLNSLILIGFLAIITSMLMTSCEKSELKPIEEGDKSKKSSSILPEAGVVHNAALDYLAANVNLNQATKEQMFTMMSDYFLNNASSQAAQTSLMNLRNQGHFVPVSISNISDWVNQNQATLSQIEINYYLQAENELNKYEQQGLGVAAAGIRSVQNSVVSDAQLSQKTKDKLFGTFSILANSLEYWDDAVKNPNNPWNSNHLMNTNNVYPPMIRIIRTAIVDAISYSNCCSDVDDEETCVEIATLCSLWEYMGWK